MLATFVVELALAVYLLIRYKSNKVRNLSVALLTLLAIFQLAEFNTCGRFGVEGVAWSGIGFVAITLLPPLAIHLIQVISRRGHAIIHWFAYITAVPWLVFFVRPQTFSGHVCAGNYAIFQLANNYGGWYFTYYYFWLLLGLSMALYFAFNAKTRVMQALLLQVAGYLLFFIPTAVTNTIKPSTIMGLPSIMCGFAVIYAVVLVFGILPRAGKTNHSS